MRLAKKLGAFWRRKQLDRDLNDELQFHLEMKAAETGDAAEAQRRIGNATRFKESCRDLWAFSKVESWWQDVRYAVRMLAKTPGFTIVAVTALALGIGADTAVFTIANSAFSWNLGLDHIDRVALIGLTDPSRHEFGVSYPDFRDLSAQTKSLAGLAAYQFFSANLSDDKTLPDRYWCVKMSSNGFFVSEQKPLIGRAFSANDEEPGAPAVAELTYHVWQDRYAKDPGILNKVIRVNEVPTTVIGVMPPAKRFPEDTDLWIPLVLTAQMESRSLRSVTLFGRLRDGVTMAATRKELNAQAGRLAQQYPASDGGLNASLQNIAEITGVYHSRPLFVTLWLAVGFVLLIACADVANMLLARGAGRVREISIRVAIGAGRVRILRQLLIESVLLAIAGGFVGWLVALGCLGWFDAATRSVVKPVWLDLSLNKSAFIYMAVISVGTGILFGLVPALRLAGIDVYSAIKDGGQGIARGRRLTSVSNLLVVMEMALCMVLLTGAGLMIHSTVNLYDTPLGVNTANVLTAQVNLPEAKYPLAKDEISFHRAIKSRIDSLPGVQHSAITSNLPMSRWVTLPYDLDGTSTAITRWPQIGAIVTSPDYFRAMQVSPRRGRTFTETDGITGPPVALINESFARQHWPTENALGKRIRLAKGEVAQPWLTVIGVLPDILENFRHPLEREPLIYLPFAQEPQREMFIVMKARVPPRTLADALRREVQHVDPNLALYQVRTLEDRWGETRFSSTLLESMFSVFAGIALVLAAVGLYAVISHSVTQRIQEIGIRVAVGGSRRDILRLVYAQGMRPVLIGTAFGLPAAMVIARVLRMALIGVSPGDPVTLLLVVLTLLGTGLAGCAIPARRAVRVDPIVALRYE